MKKYPVGTTFKNQIDETLVIKHCELKDKYIIHWMDTNFKQIIGSYIIDYWVDNSAIKVVSIPISDVNLVCKKTQ